jgi:hypothetical protein
MKKVVLKERKCKNCGLKFTQVRPLQYICGGDCGWQYADKKAKLKDKKIVSEMKKSLLTHKDYIQLLQKIFNTYIRKRDEGQPCISCGTTNKTIRYDAGHYYPTTYQFLRFNEDNVHRQCSFNCNHKLSGNQMEYTPRLEKKIGFDRMQWLHAHRHDRLEISIPELKEKIKEYKKKIASLK